MQQVLPGVYLGPYTCSRDKDYLKKFGITHILIVRDVGEKR